MCVTRWCFPDKLDAKLLVGSPASLMNQMPPVCARARFWLLLQSDATRGDDRATREAKLTQPLAQTRLPLCKPASPRTASRSARHASIRPELQPLRQRLGPPRREEGRACSCSDVHARRAAEACPGAPGGTGCVQLLQAVRRHFMFRAPFVSRFQRRRMDGLEERCSREALPHALRSGLILNSNAVLLLGSVLNFTCVLREPGVAASPNRRARRDMRATCPHALLR